MASGEGKPRPDVKSVFEGLNELSLHCCLRQRDQVKRLIAHKADPNKRDADGDRLPLHWAAARGAEKCIELLLAAGADPRARDAHGDTPADLALQLQQDAAYDRLAAHATSDSSSSECALSAR